MYLSVFDSKMSKVHKAETPEEARELIKQYTQQNFRGGSTDIAGCVKSAQGYIEKEINSGAQLYKPEIVVLTDEDTSVKSLTKADLNGTKMHGFAMSVSNPSLVAFAQSTGGIGFDKF